MSTHYSSSTIPKAKKNKAPIGRRPCPPPRLSSLGDGEDQSDQGTEKSAVPPPNIPPKPRTTKSLERQPMTSVRMSLGDSNSKADEKPLESLSMTLKDLIEQHWKSLPLRIQVQEGYSGQASQLNISTADVYNLHFLKNQDAVLLKDSMGNVYGVPLYSSLQFSLIYNPEEESASPKDSSKIRKVSWDACTTSFTKVSDITAKKILPKIVCVTKPHSSENVTLSQNELLALRSVQKTKKKVVLKAFSISDHTEKSIPNECKAHFSTSPQLTKLYLPDIINCIHEVFPSKVLIHLGDNFTLRSSMQQQYMHSALLTEPVTIVGKKRERTLVASVFADDDVTTAEIPYDLIDIPLSQNFTSDVEVSIVDMEGTELEVLQETTRTLMKDMLPSSLKTYEDATSDSIYNIQAVLHSRYRQGNERLGMDINVPLMQKLDLSKSLKVDLLEPDKDDEENEYATIDENLLKSRSPIQKQSTSTSPTAFSMYHVPRTNKGDDKRLSAIAQSNNYSEITHDQTLTNDLYSTPRRFSPANRFKHSESSSALLPTASSLYDVPAPRSTKIQHTAGSQVQSTHHRTQSTPMVDVQGLLQTEDNEEYEDMSTAGLLRDMTMKQSTSFNEIMQAQSINEGYGVFDPPSAGISALRHVQKQIQELEEKLKGLEEKIATSVNAPELKNDMDDFSQRLAILEQKISKGGKPSVIPSDSDQVGENKAKLQQLSSTQVATVLEGMGLGQYKEKFEQESVDGEILSALDDTTIRDELGVASKIHRIRITKLIDGLYSTAQFLSV